MGKKGQSFHDILKVSIFILGGDLDGRDLSEDYCLVIFSYRFRTASRLKSQEMMANLFIIPVGQIHTE